jgi:Sel1 repeat-containing protein
MRLRIRTLVLLAATGMAALHLSGTDNGAERKRWEKLAETGDANAQYRLGNFYENGWGVAVDPKSAAKWYLRAAVQGHADAQYNLGIMYLNGRGVALDAKKAFAWFRNQPTLEINSRSPTSVRSMTKVLAWTRTLVRL